MESNTTLTLDTSNVPGSTSLWQADHLIQLVGGNPMPNAIAGPLLVKPTGMITLVYSKETKTAAERLLRVLEQRTKASVQLAGTAVEASDPAQISLVVAGVLKGKSGRLALHYTAGTKAMSVHAYRAVERIGAPDTVFAYLDPRKKMLVAHHADPSEKQESLSIASEVIPLQQILWLHGAAADFEKTPITKPKQPRLAKALVDYNISEGDMRVWSDWKDGYVDTRTGRAKYAREPFSLARCPIATAFPETIASAATFQDAAQKLGFSADEFAFWLHGGWLEDWSLAHFLAAAQEGLPLKDLQRSLTIEMDAVQGAREFEVDIAAVHGSQLIVVSCTVDSGIARAKSKLFEVVQRARQMGGDEARICLVTCLRDRQIEQVSKEVQRVLNQSRHIRIFGRPDLLDLKNRLTSWLQES